MINSILKALDILSLFSAAEPRLSLSEISNRIGIPKSTAHNLLATLISRGYIERLEGEQYGLGVGLVVLSQAVRANVELRDRAAPLLRQLADICGESIYLTIRDGIDVVYLFAIESPDRLLARTAVGERVPLHCTSNGKAILSTMKPNEVQAFAKATGLPAFTPNTISRLDDLQKDLDLSRERGYALDNEEHEAKTYCVGAPVYDSQKRAIGACSISGDDPEIVTARLPLLSVQVMYTAQQISRLMGYVPQSIAHVIPAFQEKKEK